MVLTGLTGLECRSLTQFLGHRYSAETLAVLFDMVLCINDSHSAMHDIP